VRKILLIVVSVLMIPILSNAEIFPKTGTAGLQFLKLGIDARAIGMGEAYTAVSDDISSLYWNPGGLAVNSSETGKNTQVFFSHTNWVADIYHEYIGVSNNFYFGTLGLGISYLHMGEMDVTEEDPFGPTGEKFTSYDLAAGLTYSQMYTDKFSFGVTAKYLREEIDGFAVNGFSADIGSLYNTGWRNLKIGMAMRNFGPNLKYELDNDEDGSMDEDPFDLLDNDGDGEIDEDREELEFKIPLAFSLGISADLYKNNDSSILGSFQVDNCVDREETYNLGVEYKLYNFALRTGYQFNLTQRFSAGFGWSGITPVGIISIDYSYTDMDELQEDDILKRAQRISLKLSY